MTALICNPGNINTEQRAHLLEVELAENNRVIEQLREERSLLASERTELQRRFTVASDVCMFSLA